MFDGLVAVPDIEYGDKPWFHLISSEELAACVRWRISWAARGQVELWWWEHRVLQG